MLISALPAPADHTRPVREPAVEAEHVARFKRILCTEPHPGVADVDDVGLELQALELPEFGTPQGQVYFLVI